MRTRTTSQELRCEPAKYGEVRKLPGRGGGKFGGDRGQETGTYSYGPVHCTRPGGSSTVAPGSPSATRPSATSSAATRTPCTPSSGQFVVAGPPQSGRETFVAMYRLETLRRRAEALWGRVDVLALPTTGTTYWVQELLADPLSPNEKLSHYTTFVNLDQVPLHHINFHAQPKAPAPLWTSPPQRDRLVVQTTDRHPAQRLIDFAQND